MVIGDKLLKSSLKVSGRAIILEVKQGFCMMTICVSETCLTSDWTLHLNLSLTSRLSWRGKLCGKILKRETLVLHL
jgi:hypothetical protein